MNDIYFMGISTVMMVIITCILMARMMTTMMIMMMMTTTMMMMTVMEAEKRRREGGVEPLLDSKGQVATLQVQNITVYNRIYSILYTTYTVYFILHIDAY